MSTPVLRPIDAAGGVRTSGCARRRLQHSDKEGSEDAHESHEASETPRLFDPRGVVDSTRRPIAPRPATLDGLRLGILDNSKWNANKLLRGARRRSGKAIKFASVNYYVKHSFSKDAAPELIEEIAANNDIVLTAIGDCGSCCSCCIRDCVALERLGIPSAAIITTEFVQETELDPPRHRHGGPRPDRDRSSREFDHGGGNLGPRGTDQGTAAHLRSGSGVRPARATPRWGPASIPFRGRKTGP